MKTCPNASYSYHAYFLELCTETDPSFLWFTVWDYSSLPYLNWLMTNICVYKPSSSNKTWSEQKRSTLNRQTEQKLCTSFRDHWHLRRKLTPMTFSYHWNAWKKKQKKIRRIKKKRCRSAYRHKQRRTCAWIIAMKATITERVLQIYTQSKWTDALQKPIWIRIDFDLCLLLTIIWLYVLWVPTKIENKRPHKESNDTHTHKHMHMMTMDERTSIVFWVKAYCMWFAVRSFFYFFFLIRTFSIVVWSSVFVVTFNYILFCHFLWPISLAIMTSAVYLCSCQLCVRATHGICIQFYHYLRLLILVVGSFVNLMCIKRVDIVYVWNVAEVSEVILLLSCFVHLNRSARILYVEYFQVSTHIICVIVTDNATMS